MSTSGSGRAPRSSEHEALPNLKQAPLPARPRAVLEAMLSVASVALEQGVTATLNELEQQLFKLAEQAKSNEHQNRCFETLREIRRGRADVAPRFVIRLEAALASLDGSHEVPGFARMSRSERQDLSLIEPEEFEESLALQEVASKAEIRHSQMLFALGQRFGVLAGAPALEPDELPVGPHRLCECLRHAAACLDIQLEHRVLLFRAFDRICMAQFGRLYEQLNELCIEHRVLPNLQLQTPRGRRGESAPAPAAEPASRSGARTEPGRAGAAGAPSARAGTAGEGGNAGGTQGFGGGGGQGGAGHAQSAGGSAGQAGGGQAGGGQAGGGQAGGGHAGGGFAGGGGAAGGHAGAGQAGGGLAGAGAPAGAPGSGGTGQGGGFAGAGAQGGGAAAGGIAARSRAGAANQPGHPGGAGVTGGSGGPGGGAQGGGTGGATQGGDGEGDPGGALPDTRNDPKFTGFANPMTGWPGTPPPPMHDSGAGHADARDLELFETMRDLMGGRRRALGLNPPPGQENAHAVRTEDVQSVLSALQSKPAPPMMIGGKMVSRSISHLKQDLMAQLRQITPDGKPPKLAETDGDTIDLMGMLFDHLGKDAKADSAAQQLMTRLQIPLLRVALRDKSFFTRRSHPARQLLNSVAEAGLYWLDDEADDRALVEKMRLVVDRVTGEYDDDIDLFEELLGDLSKHLGTLARKSEVAERRHVDAAKGRERLELARSTAAKAIEQRIGKKNPPALIRTLLEQAWTDVLALTVLRQGENSDMYRRRLNVADQLLHGISPETLTARQDDPDTRALKKEVESGLSQVGYHGEDVQAVVNRLFGGGKGAATDDSASLTELAIKLKQRSRLGGDAPEADKPETGDKGIVGDKPERKDLTRPPKLLTPLNPEEQRVLERLRTVPFGSWFEFQTNQQGDMVRRKLSWFSTVTGRCLFVNQRGVRVDERTMEQLARDIVRGHARVVEAQKDNIIDRAWNAIMTTLRGFAGKPAEPAAAPA